MSVFSQWQRHSGPLNVALKVSVSPLIWFWAEEQESHGCREDRFLFSSVWRIWWAWTLFWLMHNMGTTHTHSWHCLPRRFRVRIQLKLQQWKFLKKTVLFYKSEKVKGKVTAAQDLQVHQNLWADFKCKVVAVIHQNSPDPWMNQVTVSIKNILLLRFKNARETSGSAVLERR